jgi:hypothetical protein
MNAARRACASGPSIRQCNGWLGQDDCESSNRRITQLVRLAAPDLLPQDISVGQALLVSGEWIVVPGEKTALNAALSQRGD